MEAKFTARFTGRTKFSDDVMNAMANVDRAIFVPEDLKSFAFENAPLSIGHGQTISQPYIVALMTDLLDLTVNSSVLEVGTGSGYQTAILAKLAKTVYTIERIDPLLRQAKQLLLSHGYKNIEFTCGNGYHGWEAKAPFDAIIVTAAAAYIPDELIKQLKPSGRMIIPVGLPHMPQELMLVLRAPDGSTRVEPVLDVSFVPLLNDETDHAY